MFQKFSKELIHLRLNVKSSVQRGLRTRFAEQFPKMESAVDSVCPKKSPMVHMRCDDKIQLYVNDNGVVFFQQFDELIPALRVVHQYPDAFPRVQVDRGAIKFVLSGANIMCPGLTSKGADLPEDLPEGALVAVYAEGKQHALAVGKMAMSTDEIKSVGKGIGVEVFTHLGDGLWQWQD